MELVERDAALQALHDAMRQAESGRGHVALVAGEAGIGKTSLLKAMAASSTTARIWWGACDALQTPHPLAPLHDIARASEVGFRQLLADDTHRGALFDNVLTDLQHSAQATLLVVEDAHWADDATLDLLKFLGRRIERTHCLLVITFRDDELSPAHPLRQLLGDLPATCVSHVALRRLSAATVERLAHAALRSPSGVFAATQGNPFFVTELLRQGVAGVPLSVQALVLARFARLREEAQAIVKLASIVPARIERSLVDALLGHHVDLIEECLNSGLLVVENRSYAFRHELARVAIEASLPAPVARDLHARVLAHLQTQADARVSLARLVHHAAHAEDASAVMRHAPEAARQAALRGAHREAAAHFKTALRHGADHADRAAWIQGYARECQLTDQLDEAIAARQELGALLIEQADVEAQAENLSETALAYVLALRNADADAASQSAIVLLEALPPGRRLAAAYRVDAQLRMLDRDCEKAVQRGQQALALATQLGEREIEVASLSSLGTAMMFIDHDAGCAYLERARDLALSHGMHYLAANIYSNLGSASGELMRLDAAERHLRQALDFATTHEIDFYRNYSEAWLGLCLLWRGRWVEAESHALTIVRQAPQRTTGRVMALVALGRLRARSGEPGADELLDEALALALASGTLQRVAPVRAARAEAASLRGNLVDAAGEARAGLALAQQHHHAWFAGELAYWLQLAGADQAVPEPCAQPYALQMRGEWREAADAWAKLGCPYEQARALAEGDTNARLEALAAFESLGAHAAARGLRDVLRAGGARGLPRGKRASTQANPHQLTARELEVIRLLCEGLKNAEIASRLCRSVRTVDHHLAAAFGKLGVNSRTEAMAAALRSGIGGPPTQTGQDRAPI